MFERDENVGSVGSLPPIAWLRLTIAVALILVLAGCGTGGTNDDSGKADTGSSDDATGQTKMESTSDGAAKTETGQTSGDDGELGTPALGDSGAPVVMVEYSDYQ